MRIINIEQNTAQWLAWRAGGIGGSDAPTVLGLSPFKTRARLFEEMTGQVEPELPNFAMKRGTRKEPEARRMYRLRTGLAMPAVCGEHDTLPWLRSSLDGFAEMEGLILEIKWPNHEAHAMALEGQVPDYYWPQVQQQLLVAGVQRLHYWSCSENKRFKLDDLYALVELLPCQDYHALLVAELGRFWGEVQAFRSR